MDAGDFRTLPVVKDGKLVGIITNRDIRKYWQKPETTKVGAVMTERPICVSPDDSVAETVRMLLAYKVGGFPVIRQHKVVGIITTTDILRAVLGLPELER
jgi:CIC family chloride channel protein